MKVQKVIPEKIISSCNECLSWHESQDWLDRDKIPCKGELVSGGKIPPDCPLKDYQPEQWLDKPDSICDWWISRLVNDTIKGKFYDPPELLTIKTQEELEHYRLKSILTKWHKAIVPTIPEPKEDK